jgi:hypothetical protein
MQWIDQPPGKAESTEESYFVGWRNQERIGILAGRSGIRPAILPMALEMG